MVIIEYLLKTLHLLLLYLLHFFYCTLTGPGPQGMGNMGSMGMPGGMMGMQGLGFGLPNTMAGRLGLSGMQQQQQMGSSVILVSNLEEQVCTKLINLR